MDGTNLEVKTEDDQWEETTVVVELVGVLDTTSTRMAIQNGNCAVRRAGTESPLIQIGNSIYAGNWSATVGSDLIFEQKSNQLQFSAVSQTRITAVKALVTMDEGNKS